MSMENTNVAENLAAQETQPKKDKICLTKKDINKSMIRWLFFSHSCYSYERLQGLGVAHAMTPIIKKLYTTKEDISAALMRSMTFFNCEPSCASMIHGFTIAVEEQKANGEDIPDETINTFKTSLMGPLSGIGDSILQGMLAVVLLSIGIDLAMAGNLFGPILFFLGTALPVWILTYIFYHKGYTLGRTVVENLLANGMIAKVTNAAGIAGLSVIGAMAALRVRVNTPITFATQSAKNPVVLQNILNMVMPNLLPLGVVMLFYFLLKKNVSPMKIVLGTFVGGILLSVIGVLG